MSLLNHSVPAEIIYIGGFVRPLATKKEILLGVLLTTNSQLGKRQ